MAATAKVEFTKRLLDSLSFDRQVIGVDAQTGALITVPTPPSVGDWWIRDSSIGLRLRLTPNAYTWYVQRKMAGKRVPRAMGHFWVKDGGGDVLTLAEARKRAEVWIGKMAQGVDPLLEKKGRHASNADARERSSVTMRVAMRRLIDETSRKAAKATSADREKVARWMDRSPLFSIPVVDVSKKDVAVSLGPLMERALGKRVASPGWGPNSISAATMTKIYAWANKAWRRSAGELGLPTGPGEGPFAAWRSGEKWPTAKAKGAEVLLDTESQAGKAWLRELIRLQTAAHNPDLLTHRPDPRSKGLKPHTGVLIDFFVILTLVGLRKGELAQLSWDRVDFKRRLIWLSPETTKNRTLACLPMTEWVEEILRARRAFNDRWRPDEQSGFVFPSRIRGKPLSTPHGILEALAEVTGLRVRAHDLRHTVATAIGSEADVKKAASLALASAALHHAKGRALIGGATDRYLHDQAEVVRDLYQKRENRLKVLAGLAEEAIDDGQSADDALLDRLLEDSDLQRRFFERMAAKR